MLEKIIIKNFVLINESEIIFSDQFNVLSGESGVGKSIIFKAINLLHAKTFPKSLIKKDCKSLYVSFLFDITHNSIVKNILKENQLKYSNKLKIEITISKQNSSSVKINDSIVTKKLLNTLSSNLIIIVSQNNNLLHEEGFYFSLVNSFIDENLLYEYNKSFLNWKNIQKQILKMKEELKYKEDRVFFLEKKIDSLSIVSEDDIDLENKIDYYSNIEQLVSSKNSLFQLIHDSEYSLTSQVLELKSHINKFPEKLKNSLYEKFIEIDTSLSEFHNILQKETDGLGDDNIDEILDRFEKIKPLINKYGSVDSIIDEKLKMEDELSYLNNLDSLYSDLIDQETSIAKHLKKKLSPINKKRDEVFLFISKELSSVLKKLNMPHASLVFQKDKIDSFNENGDYNLSILISLNKNSDLTPLEESASGGELSRILFSLYSIYQKNKTNKATPLLLDEIDTGIGGETAIKLAKEIDKLKKRNQVILITHSPQISIFGDKHFLIQKLENEKENYSTISELNEKEYINEINRMMGNSFNQKEIKEYIKKIKES